MLQNVSDLKCTFYCWNLWLSRRLPLSLLDLPPEMTFSSKGPSSNSRGEGQMVSGSNLLEWDTNPFLQTCRKGFSIDWLSGFPMFFFVFKYHLWVKTLGSGLALRVFSQFCIANCSSWGVLFNLSSNLLGNGSWEFREKLQIHIKYIRIEIYRWYIYINI